MSTLEAAPADPSPAARRAVIEIDHALGVLSGGRACRVGLTTYRHENLSPLRSVDLIASAENPEENVFFPYLDTLVSDILTRHAPDVVGISVTFLDQALTAFALAGLVRERAPRVRIVLGGGLVTSWVKGPCRDNPFAGVADELVAGPGEEFVLGLAGIRKPAAISPPPAYEPFTGNAYLSPGLVLPYATSTGCYWGRCSFCPEKAEGSSFVALDPSTVIEQVETLHESLHPCLVHFTDNAMSPSLLRSLAHRGLGVPWYGFARVTPELADPDFCRSLRSSGCVMLQLGIESGDQDVLDELHKGIRLEDASVVLTSLHEAGIGTYVYLLFGTPAENEASARRTLAFTEAHAPLIDFLNLAVFTMPRFSEEAASLPTYDFSEADLSLYRGFVHPRGWDRTRVRRFLDREFRQNQAVARILRNDPPFFTSSHAPFFLMHRRGTPPGTSARLVPDSASGPRS